VIIDSSALIAIIRREAERDAFVEEIANAASTRVSAANFLETAIVIDGHRDPIISRRLDEFIQESAITIEPVTESQARIAREAYRDFGKGSGHPAQLNFGDCFAYALARERREPLLYKGDDFGHTDIAPARL
jgi:ribonuclease VapC